MLKINSTTQRASRIIDAYNNSNATQLWHVYGSYSGAKRSAYDYCVDLMKKLGGYDLRITGANTCTFSVAFYFVNEDNEKCLAYITHGGDYYIPLGKASKSDTLNDEDWYEDFKKRYDALSDETKKHLANACPHITSREQADGIMKMSEMFDILFKMEGAK